MAIRTLLALLLAHETSPFVQRECANQYPLSNNLQSTEWKLQATSTTKITAGNIKQGDSLLRSIASIDPHPAIPVWPTWGGGKVTPVSFGDDLQDPFLLLAHHDHWFDPRDPLRGPFKAFGKALGLPYVDVEGFSMHPHRGFDIFTYILDGSDGFNHLDNLGGTSKLYRGGTCQWMRTGSGVMHEEFWETDPRRRTNIELFQLWVNLPSRQKFDEPAIEYIGTNTSHPWIEIDIVDAETGAIKGSIRDITETLNKATLASEDEERITSTIKPRPPLRILHIKLQPGGQWCCRVPSTESAIVYIRKGKATIISQSPGEEPVTVKQRNTATFSRDGDLIHIANRGNTILDMVLLAAVPLREPLAAAGPIVMNSAEEVQMAYRQLEEGTFLKRSYVLKQHREKGYWKA
ncbi:unnamed protein product [Cylindrotheca closterium]|uniref:Pirin n=1 Tax=Cylindrotheca closterium TaxID=2856 RepID=A0AAD2CII6_9STRA|nr:unnamed protein product [Cylindrotheca closterium]